MVLMAHALKRVSYATCDPECGQFAFLARNPKGPCGVQYCHVFLTTATKEVTMHGQNVEFVCHSRETLLLEGNICNFEVKFII